MPSEHSFYLEPALSVLAVIFSYVGGSIPFGLLVGWAKGVDVRQQGSGNIGATNVGRTLGKPYGFVVFGLDFLKGFGPLLLICVYARQSDSPLIRHDLPVFCALAAVLGHAFPVWLQFQGGKAGATGLGVGAVLAPWSVLIAVLMFLVIVLSTRYVSLGTLLGGAAFVASYLLMAWAESSPFDRAHIALSIFAVGFLVLLAIRHKGNIQRLLAGDERRASFSFGRNRHGQARR